MNRSTLGLLVIAFFVVVFFCPSLSLKSLLKLMSIESQMSSNSHILCHPLLLLLSNFPSIRVNSLHQVVEVLELQLQHQSFQWISRILISFRSELCDLAFQGILKSLLRHHSWKVSILQCSAFLYGPTLTSLYDYWKNQSFYYMDLCWQSDTSAF